MAAWLGLDVGTSSSKAVVYDDATAAPLATGRAPTTWTTSAQGVEIAANALVHSALSAIADAVAALPDGVAVGGVGITSMGESGVLVDRHGQPVAPVIAWHDTRDAREVDELRADLGDATFGERAGKPLRGQFSITKHRWLVRNLPETSGAVRRFNVAEWVARALGADEACDLVLACRTGWFDVAAGDWWQEALTWSQAPARLMPPVVPSGTDIGRVTDDRFAPLRGAVVTLAGHDHQAAALGVGAVEPGDELDSSGTAEALVRTVPPNLTAEQRLALAEVGVTTDLSIQPGRWSLLGGTEGGLAMQRALRLLGVARDGLPELDQAALAARPHAVVASTERGGGLALSGIREDVGPGEVWRAVVEAATAAAVRLHDSMSAIAGPHERLVATGGWCHSEMVMHAKRAGFGALTVVDVDEPGTLGAATLAAHAAGALPAGQRLGASS